MIDFIAALLALGAFAAAYNLTDKYWPLTLLITLAAILILNSLKKMVSAATENSHPPMKVFPLTEENLQNSETLGVRILLMTQGIFFHTETKNDRNYLIELSNDYLKKMGEESEILRFRYNYVNEKKYPLMISYMGCGNSTNSVRTHYATWNSLSGVTHLKNLKENRDFFGYDAEITDPRDNTVHKVMLWVVFDPSLPLPEGADNI